MSFRRIARLLIAAVAIAIAQIASATEACPDSFSVCAAPDPGLAQLVLWVPLAGLVLAVLCGLPMLARARRLTPFVGWALVFLAIVPVGLNHAFVPAGPSVYYDEFLQAEATANIAQRFSPLPCCAYRDGQCVEGGPVLWPVSTQLIASPAAMWGRAGNPIRDGARARAALNRIWAMAAPVLVFAWVWMLLESLSVALLCALWWSLWPTAVKLAGSGDLVTGAVGLMLLLLCAVEVLRKRPTWVAAGAVSGLLILAMNARLEMFALLPWVFWRTAPLRLSTRRIPFAAVLTPVTALALWPVVRIYLAGAALNVSGWTNAPSTALGFVGLHLGGNLAYWLSPEAASPLLAIAALVGGWWQRKLLPLWLSITAFFLIYSAYHVGAFSPEASPDGWRYATPIAALLMPLAGASLQALIARWGGRVTAGVAVVLLATIPWHVAFWKQPHPVAQLATQIEAHHSVLAGAIPPGATVSTRSVAYTRSLLNRVNVVERCSMKSWAVPTFDLRTWGDTGSPSCFAPVQSAGDSPDGLGPWLLRRSEACGPIP